MTPKRILALFAFIALAMAVPMFAQSDRATIVGHGEGLVVGSDAGRAGPRDQCGHKRSRNIKHGQHRFLPGGQPRCRNYVVSFSKNGFKTLERKGVTLLISRWRKLTPRCKLADGRRAWK